MTLKRSLVLIGLQLFLVSILGFVVVAPRLFPNPENLFMPSVELTLLIIAATTIGSLGLVWQGSVRGAGRTWRELGWHTDQLGKQLALGIVGGLICASMVVLTYVALGEDLSELVARFTGYSWPERLTFMCIGLQAGFIEESLFRGNLMPALKEKYGSKAANPMQAVIFAAYHLNFGPIAMVMKTVWGMIYGTLNKAGRSLVAPAVAHALFWTIVGSM